MKRHGRNLAAGALLAHTTKWTCTWIPFNAVRYAREIIAGTGETALRYYGLIPERVHAVVSMTLKLVFA